jgi:hypothetical protein
MTQINIQVPKTYWAGHQWFMQVILVIQEAETGGLGFEASPGK